MFLSAKVFFFAFCCKFQVLVLSALPLSTLIFNLLYSRIFSYLASLATLPPAHPSYTPLCTESITPSWPFIIYFLLTSPPLCCSSRMTSLVILPTPPPETPSCEKIPLVRLLYFRPPPNSSPVPYCALSATISFSCLRNPQAVP